MTKLPDDMETRTPAPEGEASLWGCADGNGIDPRLVFRDRPTAEQVAADTNMVVRPLYASPFVPVGVSREEIARIIDPVSWEALDVYGQDKAAFIGLTTDHSLAKADAILAALRPTDTGWRDIATAPRDGGDILLTYGGDDCTVARPNGDGSFDDGDFRDHMSGFTHWMPLPAAPTDTGRE
jgi:hypothetical protein